MTRNGASKAGGTLEAAIARLILKGRIFVTSARVASEVRESCEDAGVEISMRYGGHSLSGWWIEFAGAEG